jgi:hypothetical protein
MKDVRPWRERTHIKGSRQRNTITLDYGGLLDRNPTIDEVGFEP